MEYTYSWIFIIRLVPLKWKENNLIWHTFGWNFKSFVPYNFKYTVFSDYFFLQGHATFDDTTWRIP